MCRAGVSPVLKSGSLLCAAILAFVALFFSSCSGGDGEKFDQAVTPSKQPQSAQELPSPTVTNPNPTPTPFPTLTPTAALVPSPIPTSTVLPTPTPRPTPSPSGTPLEPPNLSSEFATFTNELYGFKVRYPKSWSATEGNILLGASLFVAQGELGVPRVVVDLTQAKRLIDIKTQADEVVANLKASLQDFTILADGPLILDNGREAHEYDILFSAGTLTLATKLVIAQRGGSLFQVYAQTVVGDFDGRRQELERIARSLELFTPAAFGVSREQALTLLEVGPATLDPHVIGDAASLYYAVQVFGGLVGLDQDLNIVPDLAERWDIEDGRTTYVFHLRRGATFHNGRAVTAQDVKFSFERAADPATGSATAAIYLNDIAGVTQKLAGTATDVQGIEVVDDFTLRVRINDPVPYFLAKLTHPAAFVVDEQNTREGVSWFLDPNGTGPFKLVGWQPGVAVAFERFEGYHRGAAKVPFVLVWNLGGPLAMYKAKEVDVASISPFDPVSLAIAKDPNGDYRNQLRTASELSVSYLGFNSQVEPFDDARARQAFAFSLDVDRIISESLGGALTRAAGFMPLGLPGFNPELTPTAYNPTRAKELWDQVLAEKGIAVPEVRMLVHGVTDSLVQMESMWEETLGIDVIFTLANTNDLRRAIEASKAQLFDFGWVADYPDPQNFLDVLFHSRATNNFGAFKDGEVDSLLEKARTVADQDLRFELYRKAERRLVHLAAAIPLWFQKNFALVDPKVRGWSLSAQQVPDFFNVELDRPLEPRPTSTPSPAVTPSGTVVAV